MKTTNCYSNRSSCFNPDSFSNDFESNEDRDEVREISKFVKDKLIEEFWMKLKIKLFHSKVNN